MPNTSETRAFLAEEPDTPFATTAAGIPIRAFSIDSNISAQSDLTIRPTPRPAPSPPLSPPTPDIAPKASPERTNTSPWWLVPIVVLSAFLFAGTIAPRTELLIKLACNNLHPDWDLVSNSTIAQNNTTSASLHSTRHFSIPLDLVGRAVEHVERSQITTPGTSPMCLNGTDVNQAVATLNTAIATTSGILSVLTTGWWTQASQSLSDRVGRVRILTIGAVSTIMVDAVFIAVVLYADKVPGGYNWLIFSNMVDGLFGGFATAMALSNAYISDCVSATERSRWFSLWMGFIFAGMALGPSFGSLLNGWTKNNMSIFYLATAFDLVYTVFVAFILPESLSLEARKNAYEAHKRSKNAPGASWWKESTLKLLGVLAPLAMFLPRVTKRTGGRKHYNWNATFIGIAYSLHSINSGSFSFKYQYALKAFHWSSTDMGNWLSWLGFTRALHLIVLLPLILKGIHWFSERQPTSKQALSESDRAKAIDLLVARTSLGVDISSYTASAIVTTSSSFIATTTLLSFGGGYPPAIQSLALALTEAPKSTGASTNSITDDLGSDDTGRLLGAMSVVSTLCAQIIGPSVFGMLFVATVESLPRSIFWLSATLNAAALGSLLLVRLSRESSTEDDAEYVLLNNMDE